MEYLLDAVSSHYEWAFATLRTASDVVSTDACPSYAAVIGVLGSALGLFFASILFNGRVDNRSGFNTHK